MSNLIVRMYDTEERARAAVAKLREAGFRDDAILELAPGSAQSVASAIVAGRMMGHRAEFYAERVKQGRSLVAVEAPFGQGQTATNIMDGCSPVDQELELPDDPVQTEWGEAAPLSATLGWPVLLRKSPAPLSDSLGLPTRSSSEFYTITESGKLRCHLLVDIRPSPAQPKPGTAVLDAGASTPVAPYQQDIELRHEAAVGHGGAAVVGSRHQHPFSATRRPCRPHWAWPC